MATDARFAAFIVDQLADLSAVAVRKMFGEYALYCEGKVVALICDNQFYLKPTPPGQALLSGASQAPPYPGAKPHFLITDELEDRSRFQALVRATAAALPPPKPKKPRKAAAPERPARG